MTNSHYRPPDAPAAKLFRIAAVEIFATGNFRGRLWTCDDLKQIHANFLALSVPSQGGGDPYLRCPVVIGHEEDQEILKRTDQPAAGWCGPNLRYVPTGPNAAKLIDDFENVTEQVAGWIKQKAYLTVSSEIYPDFIDDAGKHHGLVLRRVALLGGEVPQMKSLAELPQPILMADRGQQTIVISFSENRMNRDQMMALITAAGAPLSKEFLDSLSDDQVALLCTSLAGAGTPTADASTAAATQPTQMADAAPAVAPAAPAPAAAPAAAPQGTPSQIVLKYAELQGTAVRIERQVKAADELSRRRLTEEKQRTVESFCERMVKAGKLTPAEVDRSIDARTRQPKNPANAHDRLMRADNLNKIHRFGENGTLASEFDLQMAEIEARQPVVKFSEQLGDGGSYTPGQPQQHKALDTDKRHALLSATPAGRAVLAREKAAK